MKNEREVQIAINYMKKGILPKKNPIIDGFDLRNKNDLIEFIAKYHENFTRIEISSFLHHTTLGSEIQNNFSISRSNLNTYISENNIDIPTNTNDIDFIFSEIVKSQSENKGKKYKEFTSEQSVLYNPSESEIDITPEAQIKDGGKSVKFAKEKKNTVHEIPAKAYTPFFNNTSKTLLQTARSIETSRMLRGVDHDDIHSGSDIVKLSADAIAAANLHKANQLLDKFNTMVKIGANKSILNDLSAQRKRAFRKARDHLPLNTNLSAEQNEFRDNAYINEVAERSLRVLGQHPEIDKYLIHAVSILSAEKATDILNSLSKKELDIILPVLGKMNHRLMGEIHEIADEYSAVMQWKPKTRRPS